jgi:hypothetical protein
MLIDKMRLEAAKSPCKVIKFSASDGNIFSHNGEINPDCDNCKRIQIEQGYPDCTTNHAEWSILAKNPKTERLYIYCMTPDREDYPFNRFWCQTCAILLPMFGIKDIYMWNTKWVHHDSNKLIEEVNLSKNR